MGFEPKSSHPINLTAIGFKDHFLSIASAELKMVMLRALIAEARLAEAAEYLGYRLKLNSELVAELDKKLRKAEGKLRKGGK